MKLSFDRARIFVLGLLLALLGTGFWAYQGAGNSLREIRATGLRTLLNTQVGTLEQWVAERRHEAEQLAADEELGPQLRHLALGRGGDPDRIVQTALEKMIGHGIYGYFGDDAAYLDAVEQSRNQKPAAQQNASEDDDEAGNTAQQIEMFVRRPGQE